MLFNFMFIYDRLTKKSMDFEVEGERPRGRPKKIWSEVTEKDSQIQETCKEDATHRRKWRKLNMLYNSWLGSRRAYGL